MNQGLALLAIFVLVYSSVAGAVERTWISGPILFAVIILSANPPHGGTVAMVVVCTVSLSILAQRVTANPGAKAFGGRMRQVVYGAVGSD